ncbi:hypothetical protein BSL78_09018 [Apostichopus japonicus]|uniref:Uncharacterized protein n=1 Tax=Stichopus japonicus TaxID=307972 RepID=A0A2G8L1R5_STIJA|nr:hypothetical protein BSL78_09018 [Apostichopus japonicus]
MLGLRRCGSCQDDLKVYPADDIDTKVLRSGKKIDSAPSSQEDPEVKDESHLQDLGCGSRQDDIKVHPADDIDTKVLRSGKKIDSAPSSQEDPEVKDESHLQDMLQSLTFIQCENESCLKWRKIAQEEVELYNDKKWFCRMNKNDPEHCRCDQPEEDQFVQLAESSGFRYTFSTFQCGALVWARMPGHVQWPAIISLDPDSKDFFWKEGITEFYHVEFLGKRRTHQWVSPLYVDPYGNGRMPEFPQDTKMKNKKGKKKVHTRAGSLLRSKSYQKSFDFAVTEAESFRKLTNEMRLEKCVYIPKTMSLEAKKKEAKPLQKDEFNQTKLDTGQKQARRNRKCNELTLKRLENGHEVESKLTSMRHRKHAAKQKSAPKQTKEPKCRKKLFKSKKDHCNLSQVLLQEERLFNGAWAHFMKSRELVFDRKLSFNGSSLSAFRLFMSVQERGGYKEMTSPDWEAITSELSKKSSADKCQASLLKKLYKRNLLPYEKHLLPGKQDDVKNVNEIPPAQGEAMTNVTQSETIPPSTVECRYPLPGMNMQQMVAPFMKGNPGCVTSAYTVPYSINNTSVPQVNRAFKQVSAPPASCSSGSSSLSYYGGGSGTNCGPYLANWRTAVPMNDASKTLVVKEAERKVEDLRNNNLNYRQDTFKVPHPQQTVINSGYSPRTCTSFSNYGGSSGMISSVTHTDQWRAPSAPSNGRDVLRRPQFNEPRSQTGYSVGRQANADLKRDKRLTLLVENTIWLDSTTSSEFDKDMLEIDNIIQALDKPQQFDTSIQCQPFKPAEVKHPTLDFFSMRYDAHDPMKRGQHKKVR